jgi:hypothetical protein
MSGVWRHDFREVKFVAAWVAGSAKAERVPAGGRPWGWSPPLLAAHLAFMVAEARRHALALEEALRPIQAASMPPRPSRRFAGHAAAGSNVITLRAG